MILILGRVRPNNLFIWKCAGGARVEYDRSLQSAISGIPTAQPLSLAMVSWSPYLGQQIINRKIAPQVVFFSQAKRHIVFISQVRREISFWFCVLKFCSIWNREIMLMYCCVPNLKIPEQISSFYRRTGVYSFLSIRIIDWLFFAKEIVSIIPPK